MSKHPMCANCMSRSTCHNQDIYALCLKTWENLYGKGCPECGSTNPHKQGYYRPETCKNDFHNGEKLFIPNMTDVFDAALMWADAMETDSHETRIMSMRALYFEIKGKPEPRLEQASRPKGERWW